MSFKVLLQPAQIDLVEQRSRFIGIGYPCLSLHQFKEKLDELKQEYSDATHITYAYRIQDNQQIISRFHDAGEPSGTAGKPIFAHIEGQDLINVVIFVVRYFGGVKLGTGGLARAYGNTARLLLQSAPIGLFVPMITITFTVNYGQERQVDYLLQRFGGITVKQEYEENVRYEVSLPEEHKAEFLNEVSSIR